MSIPTQPVMAGSLALSQVWDLSVGAGSRIPHQCQGPCEGEPEASQAIMLAVVPGEHKWRVTCISSLALWSWRIPACQQNWFTLHFPRKHSACKPTNAHHWLSWLFDLNIVKCLPQSSGMINREEILNSQNLGVGLSPGGGGRSTITEPLTVSTYSQECISLKRVFKISGGDLNPLQCPYCPFQCQPVLWNAFITADLLSPAYFGGGGEGEIGRIGLLA